MNDAAPQSRPRPVHRKEVIDTETWGEVAVSRLMLADRLSIGVPSIDSVKQRDGETEAECKKRNDREFAVFLCELCALSVLDRHTSEPLYSVDEWQLWATDEKAAADTSKVVNKALEMNGFRTLSQEDVPKNG
jgi:hypothetical protein